MSADILKRLADAARTRTVADQKQCRPETLRRIAENRAAREPEKAGAFEAAIRAPGMAFICEVKKASPSRGLIALEFPYLDIAREYEAAGASAISCLTEPDYFMGQDAYLKAIAETVALPVLRKDFTVDPYMIYQAKALGAAAVLLIAAILDDGQLAEFRALAESLGLSALMEAHTPDEVDRVLKAGAPLVGLNNRNLQNTSVHIHTSGSLRA